MLGRRRRSRYKFTEKKHSLKGILTTVGAVLLIVLFIGFIGKAYHGKGNLSTYYGSAGVLALFLSVTAIGFAISSMKEENSFQLFPRISFFTSLLAFACWAGIYGLGFMM